MNKWSFVAHRREWNRIYEMETTPENPNMWLSSLHYISLIKCDQLNIKVIYSLLYKWKEKIHYYNWCVRNSWPFYTNEVKHDHSQKRMTKKNHWLSSCWYRRTQCSMSHVFHHISNSECQDILSFQSLLNFLTLPKKIKTPQKYYDGNSESVETNIT